jgi:hypothetical protein
LLGDRVYDSDPLDAALEEEGIEMIAPHRRSRRRPKTRTAASSGATRALEGRAAVRLAGQLPAAGRALRAADGELLGPRGAWVHRYCARTLLRYCRVVQANPMGYPDAEVTTHSGVAVAEPSDAPRASPDDSPLVTQRPCRRAEGRVAKEEPEQHSWWQVACSPGVDYFSTLGYIPCHRGPGSRALSPIATLAHRIADALWDAAYVSPRRCGEPAWAGLHCDA